MLCQHIFTTKTLQKTFAKVLFVFIFCFVKDKYVKIFDTHIMWLAFISYEQQIHHVFKFLIWNLNWKSQLVFITKHINANVSFCSSLAKIFFSQRKLNSIIRLLTSFLFSCVILSGVFTGLICLLYWSFFWSWLIFFFEHLNYAGNFM